jgi:hypothetical protein
MKVQKILLIGEFSNLHWTLAEGLRKLGHKVVVISNGDGWKNYERDIDIKFKSFYTKLSFLYSFFFSNLFKGYDVVQLIGCSFLFTGTKTPWNKVFFIFLKKYNKKIFLGAFGDDYYYQNACINKVLKYSPYDTLSKGDFYTNDVYNFLFSQEKFNKYLANNSDGIIAGCADYFKAYDFAGYSLKLKMIPFPINIDKIKYNEEIIENTKLRFFIGIQKTRSSWKGTDVLENELRNLEKKYSDIEIITVTNVPYKDYIKMYSESDVLVDQLYSYSPGMNALTAMLQSKIVISGGELDMYQLLGENDIYPIININPNIDITKQLLDLINMDKNELLIKKRQSAFFVKKHHDYLKIAQQYLDFWNKFNN